MVSRGQRRGERQEQALQLTFADRLMTPVPEASGMMSVKSSTRGSGSSGSIKLKSRRTRPSASTSSAARTFCGELLPEVWLSLSLVRRVGELRVRVCGLLPDEATLGARFGAPEMTDEVGRLAMAGSSCRGLFAGVGGRASP